MESNCWAWQECVCVCGARMCTLCDNITKQGLALISVLNAAFVCGAFQRAAGAFKASIVVQSHTLLEKRWLTASPRGLIWNSFPLWMTCYELALCNFRLLFIYLFTSFKDCDKQLFCARGMGGCCCRVSMVRLTKEVDDMKGKLFGLPGFMGSRSRSLQCSLVMYWFPWAALTWSMTGMI